MSKSVTFSERPVVLKQQRNLKMARSAERYVRGTPVKFYEWLKHAEGGLIPKGPPVWICGDCHLGNLGPLANANGKIEIAIRDFDQTVIGNPAHDLIRLALSLATAARGSDLPGVTTAEMLEQMVDAYDKALSHRGLQYVDFEDVPKPLHGILNQAVRREWAQLLEEDLHTAKGEIPLGKCFWPLSKDEKNRIDKIFSEEQMQEMVSALHSGKQGSRTKVLDAAYWMKGCSSLGRLRSAVLLQIGKGDRKDGGLCLMDIKEAVKPAAPRRGHKSIPKNNASRVIEGASHLSPYLGRRMRAANILGHEVFIRELMPQDMKIELENLSCEEATAAARYLAMVLGKAHGRQMDLETRREWRAEFDHHRPKKLNAPSWLWKSVVELVAIHETAYLEHCRDCKPKTGCHQQ
jgi:uncharacterized protein (DUF2252 family)